MHTRKIPLSHIILRLILIRAGIDHKDGKTILQYTSAFIGLDFETSS